MKIAILTLPLHTNYGGILQAYALQTVLQRMGHEVELIQKDFNENSIKYWSSYCINVTKKIIKKLFIDWNTSLYLVSPRKKKALRQNTDFFIKNNINLRLIHSLLEIGPEDYKALIVGSDQVWRRIYFDPHYKSLMFSTNIEDAFLKFAETWNIKRIAYAASFGVDRWEYSLNETIACAQLLCNFNGVSVREKSGIVNCKKYLGYEAQHVLDPTLLLNKEDYIALFDSNRDYQRSHEESLFCYILDKTEKKSRIIEDISFQTGYKPLFMKADITDDQVQPSIIEWIKSFMDSSLVVTDSFHACVFSIIFNKPFIAIGNKERGLSRFISLLDLFGIKERLITEEDREFPPFHIPDWTHIDRIREDWRKKSLKFLENSLR